MRFSAFNSIVAVVLCLSGLMPVFAQPYNSEGAGPSAQPTRSVGPGSVGPGSVGPGSVGKAPLKASPTGSLYVRAGAGVILPNTLDQDLSFDPVLGIASPPTSRETDFGPGAQAAFAVGFDYPSGTRTELEYRYSSPSVREVLEVGAEGDIDVVTPILASNTTSAQFLMANIFFDFNKKGCIKPFLGVGVGGAFVRNGLGDRDSAFAYQGRAGFATEIGDALFFDVEYIYTRTRDLVFGPEDFSESDETVLINGDAFAASSVMASLRKRF